MDTHLSLSVVEIIVLMLGAITLGVTIHFFISSRRSFSASMLNLEGTKSTAELTEWKLRYFNDTEDRDKLIIELKRKLADAEENAGIFSIEADEMRKLNKKLKAELEEGVQEKNTSTKNFYTEQLRQAQKDLMEHNAKITQLLSQIEIVKESEEQQQQIMKLNEELADQVKDLQQKVSEKEEEIGQMSRKEHITTEMNSILDNAYIEFNTLQDKIKKLETQASNSRHISLDFDDLKEEHYKLSADMEELKLKWNASVSENLHLRNNLAETEDKLKEANFQRQQLQKRVAYLEDINEDMQTITEVNKKLEGQMKKIGELESMLNIVAEERDVLARRHG
jgi:chromosome segregation ATPase